MALLLLLEWDQMWRATVGKVLGFIPGELRAATGRLIGAMLVAMDLRLEGVRIATGTDVHVDFRLGFELLVSG